MHYGEHMELVSVTNLAAEQSHGLPLHLQDDQGCLAFWGASIKEVRAPARTEQLMTGIWPSRQPIMQVERDSRHTWEVEAVGMGATRRELRRPCCPMSLRSPSQSQRSLGAFTPHRSCCSSPSLAGLPWYVEYVPAHARTHIAEQSSVRWVEEAAAGAHGVKAAQFCANTSE